MSHSVRTIQQLLREFWLPLLVAMAWTIYAVWGKPLDLKTIVSVLGPAFFLASWMTGHFFRVRKQENVQTGLTSLEGRLEGLVGQLESQAKEITQFTTGGDSYCYFSIGVGDNSNQSTWTVVHEGKYPLYDVNARIVDLEIFSTAMSSGNPFAADTIVQIGDIGEKQACMLRSIDLGPSDARDFNIFFSARSGFFNQLVRFRRVDGKWREATSVLNREQGEEPLLLRVQDGYPLDANGKPDGI
jgi:hypothetical protein